MGYLFRRHEIGVGEGSGEFTMVDVAPAVLGEGGRVGRGCPGEGGWWEMGLSLGVMRG